MNTSGKNAGSQLAPNTSQALYRQQGHAFQNHFGSVTASVEGKASFVISSKGRKTNPTESAFQHPNPVLSHEQCPNNYLRGTDGDGAGRLACTRRGIIFRAVISTYIVSTPSPVLGAASVLCSTAKLLSARLPSKQHPQLYCQLTACP